MLVSKLPIKDDELLCFTDFSGSDVYTTKESFLYRYGDRPCTQDEKYPDLISVDMDYYNPNKKY